MKQRFALFFSCRQVGSRGSSHCCSLLLVLVAIYLPSNARAGDQTNQATVRYIEAELDLDHPPPSDGLWTRFLEEAVSSDAIVFDRFTGPASQLTWDRRQNFLGYQAFDRFNNDGARLFTTIASDSLRTAAIAALPLDSWQEQWERGLAHFLTGTLGNPLEEHVGLRSIYYSAARSSWERANENVGIQWGLRPWRTSPYLYFLANAGRLDGRPLLTFEGRAGYNMFGSAALEGRLALQLPRSFQIAGAGGVDPTRIGSGNSGIPHISVTLERVLSVRDGSQAVFFLGFRSGVHSTVSSPQMENLLVAGLSRRW